MGKSNVEIYLRVRPSATKHPQFSSIDTNEHSIKFNLPKDESGGYINNQRVNYEFDFNGVFDPSTKQVRKCYSAVLINVLTGRSVRQSSRKGGAECCGGL